MKIVLPALLVLIVLETVVSTCSLHPHCECGGFDGIGVGGEIDLFNKFGGCGFHKPSLRGLIRKERRIVDGLLQKKIKGLELKIAKCKKECTGLELELELAQEESIAKAGLFNKSPGFGCF